MFAYYELGADQWNNSVNLDDYLTLTMRLNAELQKYPALAHCDDEIELLPAEVWTQCIAIEVVVALFL